MRAVIYYTTTANGFIRNFYFSFTPKRSSLFWNRIARHERHDCDMSDMIASQAIHERHECDRVLYRLQERGISATGIGRLVQDLFLFFKKALSEVKVSGLQFQYI